MRTSIERQLFKRIRTLITSYSYMLWRHPLITNSNDLSTRTKFSLIYPFKENVIVHHSLFKRLDIKKITISHDFLLDFSLYHSTEITIHNILELDVIIENSRSVIKYFNSKYPQGNTQIIINKLMIKTMKKTYKQMNSEGISTLIYYYFSKININNDHKILRYSKRYLSVISGNGSIPYNYDTYPQADRFSRTVMTVIAQNKMNALFLIKYLLRLKKLLNKPLTSNIVKESKKTIYETCMT